MNTLSVITLIIVGGLVAIFALDTINNIANKIIDSKKNKNNFEGDKK